MYAAFFGLTHLPFSIAPDPRYLFLSERHREALAHLLYGVEGGGGFVLLTGEIGAGKTTVCRRFLEQIPAHTRVAYIFNPKLSANELLETIGHEFGVTVSHAGPGPATVKEHLDPLNAHLLQSHARGANNVLIIDEAQSLSAEVLEQLRLLTNLETNERKLLQIILIGQPELRTMLNRPELEQLAQRVIARFHLGALNESETCQYVAHRLGVAGWRGALPFTAHAIKRVHKLAAGVPRRINLLCDRALLGAYAGGTQQVSASIVEQAAKEVFEGQRASAKSGLSFGWRGLAGGVLAGAALAGGVVLWWGRALGTALLANTAQGPATPPEPAPIAISMPMAAPPPVPAVSQAERLSVAEEPTSAALPEATEGVPLQSAWFEREDQAFAALSHLWGHPLGEQEPCTEAQQNGLQCYRTPRMTEHGLQQLDRPAALKLETRNGGSGYVLATAIRGDNIELQDAQQKRWRLPLSALPAHWQGYYATLWRTPSGQRGRLNNGYKGTAAEWMGERLSQLQKEGRLPAEAKSLKDKVEAFQRAHGIEVDGNASPTTFLLLNQASGVDEPHLLATQPE